VLFSKQDKPSWIFKALSSAPVLERTLEFAFTSDADLVKKYEKKFGKGKKLPALLMFRNGGKDVEKYKGDMNFRDIKEWANTYSESGMGDTVNHGSGADESAEQIPLSERKPWLTAEIPELTKASHKEICMNAQGLCCIYLKDGSSLDPKEEKQLIDFKNQYKSQLEGRGTNFNWMWMDTSVETGFKELFQPEEGVQNLVVFNPHKRLRFMKHEYDEIFETQVSRLMDNILGGNGRFKPVKGQKLPEWADRKAAEKKQEL